MITWRWVFFFFAVTLWWIEVIYLYSRKIYFASSLFLLSVTIFISWTSNFFIYFVQHMISILKVIVGSIGGNQSSSTLWDEESWVWLEIWSMRMRMLMFFMLYIFLINIFLIKQDKIEREKWKIVNSNATWSSLPPKHYTLITKTMKIDRSISSNSIMSYMVHIYTILGIFVKYAKNRYHIQIDTCYVWLLLNYMSWILFSTITVMSPTLRTTKRLVLSFRVRPQKTTYIGWIKVLHRILIDEWNRQKEKGYHPISADRVKVIDKNVWCGT